MTSHRNYEAEEHRPSIFDRFDDDLYRIAVSSEASVPSGVRSSRPKPLLSRRAAERQKLWATVFSALVLGLAVGGWQWSLNLSRANADTWREPLQPIAQSFASALPDASGDDELSAKDDIASFPTDPDRNRESVIRTSASAPVQAVRETKPREEPLAPLQGLELPIRVAAFPGSESKPQSSQVDSRTVEEVPRSVPETETSEAAAEPVIPEPATAESSISEPEITPVRIARASKISGSQPQYPATALRAGLEGSVVLEARINNLGRVESIETVESVSEELEQASREALAQWRFKPAQKGDETIEDTYRVRFRFDAPEPPTRIATKARGKDRPPVKISSPLPTYPPEAWAANTRGEVKLRVLVNEQGEVGDIEVVSGLPNGVSEATIAAVEQWKFKPALLNGKPVSAYEDLIFRF